MIIFMISITSSSSESCRSSFINEWLKSIEILNSHKDIVNDGLEVQSTILNRLGEFEVIEKSNWKTIKLVSFHSMKIKRNKNLPHLHVPGVIFSPFPSNSQFIINDWHQPSWENHFLYKNLDFFSVLCLWHVFEPFIEYLSLDSIFL